MKRLALQAALWIAIATALAAQEITVTSPAAGTGWSAGNNLIIRWTHSGRMADTVKIFLVAVPGGPRMIEDSTANDDAYEWPIASDVAEGTYFIRIRTTDDAVRGRSENFFIRAAAAPVPQGSTLRISHPTAGENVCLNGANEITWDPGNTTGQRVDILVLHGTRPQEPIATNIENSGLFRWLPAAGTPAGPNSIAIQSSSDHRTLGTSDPFHLVACVTFTTPLQSFTPCLAFVGPAAGARLAIGQYHEIRWRTTGPDCGDHLQLSAIRQADNAEIPIRGGLGNAQGEHAYGWLIDRGRFGDHAGTYKIHAVSSSGKTADSAAFEVTTESSGEAQQDLILSIDPSSVEFRHVAGGAELGYHMFRIRATLRMMNASRTPAGGPQPEIREVKCQWRVQLERNGVWETMDPADVAPNNEYNGSQPFWVGPFRSGAWTEQRVTIDFYVWATTRMNRRILFTLDPDSEINDPIRSNNVAHSTAFIPPAAD